MLKFKVGDNVKITAGKDKGRDGVIEKLFPKEMKALVPGTNMYKKHVKGVPGREGGIYDLPRPLAFGKFAIVCPICKKETRVGFSVVDAKKIRMCKKCGREIDKK
jgi:large subunit ribosomal protein L24